MSFLRATALRASSLTRAARPARYVRSELQPWQRAVQRRTYASGHGAHGETQSSDVPWYVLAFSRRLGDDALCGDAIHTGINIDISAGWQELLQVPLAVFTWS
jgi:hypothetical protein